MALDYAVRENPEDPTTDLDGYEVVNYFAEYVPPQLETPTLRAEVTNLFNADYAERATYGADFVSITPLNEPGRTLSLTAVARF